MSLLVLAKKLKNQSSLANRRGQAVIEYVLILVVTVAMVMALGYQVFKPFQQFVKSYMGDYTACLLETGELPSLGNSDAAQALADEGCNSKFEAASLTGGRPPKGGGGSKASGSGANQSIGKKDASSGSGSAEGSSGGGGSSYSSTGGNNLLISSMKKKTGTEAPGSASDKVTEIPLASGGSFHNRQNSFGSEARARFSKSTYVGIAGMTEDEKKKQERKDASRRVVASGESLGGPIKKIAIKKPEPKPLVEAGESPFTFGNFFRFLIIAAIVIAIIVVLGSQALKIAKSQEK